MAPGAVMVGSETVMAPAGMAASTTSVNPAAIAAAPQVML